MELRSIYWFRNDLRLSDNLSLNKALDDSKHILFIYIDDEINYQQTSWNFIRNANHRKTFIYQGISSLNKDLKKYGHSLNVLRGNSVETLIKVIQEHHIDRIFCEEIFASEEREQIELLKKFGVNVKTFFQSSLFNISQLPFTIKNIPDVFTKFRKSMELEKIEPNNPEQLSNKIKNILPINFNNTKITVKKIHGHKESSFPIYKDNFMGGELNAIENIKKYFQSNLPQSYKDTRNNLMGLDFSTKFSPWLASGFISPRQIYAYLKDYEHKFLANESTYWIFFELLWRDFFRFIFIKYGDKFFYKSGLGLNPVKINHNTRKLDAWIKGKTSDSFINAGMTELYKTGFLSNRMRQIVASYLVNELSCDWRSGASWFESQLIDYDVYSNYGNWAYIAGCGTDPRGGRHFNVDKQKKIYDPDGIYQKVWNES
jgi:deoxyribodipyrimidine photo-lyase